MRIEFEKLEQRDGTHVVPVKMTREELEKIAEQMADYTVRINAKEDDLRSYSKDIREQIKDLEEQRTAVTNAYRFKREPKPVEGLWGFDFDDHGTVRCRTCLERHEKNAKAAGTTGEGVPSFTTDADLIADHDFQEMVVEDGKDGDPAITYPNQIGPKHPVVTVWSRPLGTKWFVEPTSGDVFGPVPIVEKDMQKELAPATREVEPFAIAFDSVDAIPLLDAKQVSAAEAKIRADEKKKGHDRSNDDTIETCTECGLPLRLHDQASADPCKAAMLKAASEELAAQDQRTQEKYGADNVLDPDETYPCDKCSVATFGRDLMPVTIDGEEKRVCFACEQNVTPAAEPEQKKKARKKKDKGGDQPTA